MSKIILLGFFVDRPWPLVVTYLKFTKHDHLSLSSFLAATKNVSSPICVLTTLFILQVMSDTGWGPQAAQMFDSEDPMIQQMNIIRNYIKQAR